jgi:regulator of sirC expression with transglutaminase-like and TPR domain
MAAPQEKQLSKEEKRQQRTEARRLLKNVKQFYEGGDLVSAKASVDSLCLLDPSNPDGVHYKGRIFLRQNDTAQAIITLEAGVEQAARSTRLKILLGRLYLVTGQHDQAMQMAEAVLALKPREASALYLKGATIAANGDTAQASAVLEEALRLALEKRGN